PLDDGEQVGELGTTAIFAFCKNAETRQYLREIQFSKQLKYLNVLLDVSPISEEIAQSWMQQAYNHAITAAVVHNSNNKIIKQKNDEIRQKDGEIRQINEIIHHKDGEIHNVHETIHHKNEEIDHLKNRIIALETSTSWKITKPLRNIKKAFWALTE
ncbi:MAG: hypothetical protein FWG64_05725, partial [Firmicutes bacterium]|nr:hypothetical protein [Bacillota bacterium]